MQFILVNDRAPRVPAACPCCSKPLGLGYLREMSTHDVYCDSECYQRNRKSVGVAICHPTADPWSTARPTHLSGLYADWALPT